MCSSDLKGKSRAQTTPKKPKKKKPQSLPGDRKSPEISSSIRPIYPKAALNNNWEGDIRVEFTINDKGIVSDYKVLKSTGFEALDASFIRTVKQHYKFKPRRIMGKNKSGKIKLKYRFSLGD